MGGGGGQWGKEGLLRVGQQWGREGHGGHGPKDGGGVGTMEASVELGTRDKGGEGAREATAQKQLWLRSGPGG